MSHVMVSTELVEDPERAAKPETGIPVRALTPSGWSSVDIAHLTRDSLLAWLQSRPDLAQRVVLMLLGHEVGE